jgi:hypothetical protein
MGLKDFFRASKPMPHSGQGGFWDEVRNLCAGHIDRMVVFFKSKGAPRMDWAEPRFRALVAPATLDRLIKQAQQQLNNNTEHYSEMPEKLKACGTSFKLTIRNYPQLRSVLPIPIDMLGQWFVVLSVFPSAADADFLAACPDSSYENLARTVRNIFRDSVTNWKDLDFAHWILLCDEPAHQASVHLHTIWNFSQRVRWVIPTVQFDVPTVISAPIIIPVDLMKEDILEFERKLSQQDAKCCDL